MADCRGISFQGRTYRALLAEGTAYLEACGVPDAGYDAWALLSMATGMSRSRYLMDQMRSLEDEAQLAEYAALLQKRGERIPLQHILGRAPFMEYEFYVNEHVLTPRADTEILVEETFRILKEKAELVQLLMLREKLQQNTLSSEHMTDGVRVLDMCTGSGCIALSLYLMAKERQLSVQVTGVDLSEDALQVAERNNRELTGEAVKFIHSDMFQQLPEDMGFDIIVSNPPYIPSREIEHLMPEVKAHEPHMALDGLEDGLYYYRILAREGRNWLRSGGVLALEIGYDQGTSVPALLIENGFTKVQLIQDLAGLDRVVIGVFDSEGAL